MTHQKIHTDEKPFTCPHCAKTFRERSNLVRHERIHTSEKPYSCPKCQKAYSTNHGLKYHLPRCKGVQPAKKKTTNTSRKQNYIKEEVSKEHLDIENLAEDPLMSKDGRNQFEGEFIKQEIKEEFESEPEEAGPHSLDCNESIKQEIIEELESDSELDPQLLDCGQFLRQELREQTDVNTPH